MDLNKIGKFISEKRKNKNLTQEALAEKLYISDRAVSKWERGLCLPDASIMIPLCEILDINVNELLSGEMLNNKNYNEQAEKNLLEMTKQKEEADRKMLKLEWVIGYTSSVTFLILVFIASFLEMPTYLRIILIMFGLITFMIGMYNAIKIEQTAGYYECKKCYHKYVPSYSSVLWAMHLGTTRYLKCPKCNEKSWNKKVLTK